MLVFATSVVTTFLVDGSNKVSTYIVKGRMTYTDIDRHIYG